MKATRSTVLGIVATILVGFAASTTVFASVIVITMSFEEVLGGSDLVVLGKIIESPEIGVADPELGVRRQHTILVEQYVKGEGTNEITVITAGGKYWKEGRLYEGIPSGFRQLPPEGTEVLLFLRGWSRGYLIYSFTHGVIQVEYEPDRTRFVWLNFRRPEAMPPDTLANYEAALERGLKPGAKSYLGRVEVHDLKAVADLILNPRR